MYAIDWLYKRSILSPSKIALIDQISDRQITYEQWNSQVNRMSHFLRQSLGVRQADRVAIISYNNISYLDLCFACGKCGAILQHINWRLAVEELRQLLCDAPLAVFYDSENLHLVRALQPLLPDIPHWVAIEDLARPTDLSVSDLSSMPDSEPPRIHLQDDDPWFFCYTGGTTGLPKAAIISHGNVIANAINTVISWGLDCRDVAILNAPLFHAGGLNVFTLPLVYAGGTSIVCKKFDANEVYELIANQGVTVFFGVPTMFAMLQEHPRWLEADFSGLKFVISGGMACPISIFEKFWDKGVEFKTGYGLTEAGPNTFWLPSEFVQDKPGSVGVPLMHIEVDIVDPDGQSVPDEQIGELRIRGPHVFQGYWHHPSETVAALRDGWLYTGDLARRDHDGFFYIAGRRKDMFISGGENIYPAEIENVLHAHPSVGEAAVIAIPHDKWGEIGLAIVRLLPNHEPTEAQILEHCRSHLARYKIPRKVIFTELIPKTGAGKIDKQLLLKTYQ